ncbi:hypothetical protein A605_12170 [Corynebacterium halotolerans YIM 70093 = DSM 44683]|uniref:Uncharacterized protein n=1 Tax=Corynebacterium halotolerans YIM 70093 = DSM 44683 TaxID=1121362 RepID=M1P0X7_9CORY|nr:hypothetical protein A605_12170 [Corynebacterium halotolerans YIM 70093 = DSM 44683]
MNRHTSTMGTLTRDRYFRGSAWGQRPDGMGRTAGTTEATPAFTLIFVSHFSNASRVKGHGHQQRQPNHRTADLKVPDQQGPRRPRLNGAQYASLRQHLVPGHRLSGGSASLPEQR